MVIRSSAKRRLVRVKEHLRTSLWVAPAVAALVGVCGAFALVRLDATLLDEVGFDGGPESARELLSTISSAMLTFTALVFSITILVLQLASNQFSPRVIRTFLRERVTKLAMATAVTPCRYAVASSRRWRTV